MRSVGIALALATCLPLGASPALAGLMGQAVSLNGNSAIVGSGVEFTGVDPNTRRSFAVDFTDDALNITFAGLPPRPDGASVGWNSLGASLKFSFALPSIRGVAYAGGSISAPVAPTPPSNFSPCQGSMGIGTYCSYSLWSSVAPSFDTKLEWTADSISLRLYPQDWFDQSGQSASFRIGSTPTPVPEPASLALFGVGLAGVMLARRKRADSKCDMIW